MNSSSSYWRFWIRGLWVFLMLVINNAVLGLVLAAIGSIVRSLSGVLLWVAYVITILVVGLPFMGWLFEKFASRLPRLQPAATPSSIAL